MSDHNPIKRPISPREVIQRDHTIEQLRAQLAKSCSEDQRHAFGGCPIANGLAAERDALRARVKALEDALRLLDKAAMDVVYAENVYAARLAVHYLSEALKGSHTALKEHTP